MQQNRRGGNGWLGWVIFVVLIFGSRFLPPVANWLSQVTGLQISAPMLVAAIVGLGVLSTIFGSIATEVRRNRSDGDTRLPTGQQPVQPPQTLSPPRSSGAPPATPAPRASGLPRMRQSSGDQRLPGPPRFEPIIDPRVLTIGIIGLVLFGGFFFVALLLSGALP